MLNEESLNIDGIGFMNAKQATKTLDLIHKRSLVFQFQVVSKLFNEGKAISKKDSGIEDAMNIFRAWMTNYHDKKLKAVKYPFLSLQVIERYSSQLENKQFYQIYKQVNGKHDKLHYILIQQNKPKHYDWYSYRDHYIDVLKRKNAIFLEKDWFNDNNKPNKYHLRLIGLGYSPFPHLI